MFTEVLSSDEDEIDDVGNEYLERLQERVTKKANNNAFSVNAQLQVCISSTLKIGYKYKSLHLNNVNVSCRMPILKMMMMTKTMRLMRKLRWRATTLLWMKIIAQLMNMLFSKKLCKVSIDSINLINTLCQVDNTPY